MKKLQVNTTSPSERGSRLFLHVITFHSVAQAFRAEKILRLQGIVVKLIPIPRSLSGSCEGLAASIAENDAEKAVAILTEQSVEMLQKGIRVKAD